MKYFKLTLFALILSLFAYQCNSLEDEIAEPNVIVEGYGEMHNEIVLDFFLNFEQSSTANGRTLDEVTQQDVVEYMKDKYGVDVMQSNHYIFSDVQKIQANARTAETFDAYAFLDSYKDQISEYFYNKFYDLLLLSEELQQDKEFIAAVIDEFKIGVLHDENFTEDERGDFLVMLDIFHSSLELWSFVREVEEKNGRTENYNCRQNAWKIATSDFVGGLGGGILGGPAGALVGIGVSSINSAISHCAYVRPIDCSSSITACSINIPGISGNRPPVDVIRTLPSFGNSSIPSNYNLYNLKR